MSACPGTRACRADDGFTLVEVLVAIAVVSVVMLSLAAYFVTATRVDSEQGDRQAGIQAADDAMERARALQAGTLLAGRDRTSSARQWSAPIAAVADLLDPETQTMAYDPHAAPGDGTTAALPTTYRSLVLNGIAFRQYWYIGSCRRPATGGACLTNSPTGQFTSFYRVVVGVTWPGRSCPGGVCAYVTSSLFSSRTEEPVFDTNDVPVTLAAGDGTVPYAWSATGPPPGVTQAASTGLLPGTPRAPGAHPVLTRVTDAAGAAAAKSTTWTVS